MGWLKPMAQPNRKPSSMKTMAAPAQGRTTNTSAMMISAARMICHSRIRLESQGIKARLTNVPTANSENTVPMMDAEKPRRVPSTGSITMNRSQQQASAMLT